MARQLTFVIGTRAQLIKVAPVVVECERRQVPCTLLMTGQHHETMQDLMSEFGIRSPQVHALPSNEHSTIGSLFRWLPAAYRGIHRQLRTLADRIDGMDVLVHGDTLSTVLGAFAARHVGGRLVHLESGLTSGRLFDPFPEELSRRLVFRLAHVAMCPSVEAYEYMRKQYPTCKAVNTQGNTILDAVALSGVSKVLHQDELQYLVVSLHRFQNIYADRRLREIVSLIETLAEKFVIHFVLHPATRKRLVREKLLGRLQGINRVKLSPRLGYGEFLRLAAGAECVLTDGGSNQEELAAIGVPTIVMRRATERSDGIGVNILMEADVPGGVRNYLLSGDYKTLASTSRRGDVESPSRLIVNFLENDTAPEKANA
jgi:UDP-N-acetylglucosamine 2-epimerase (non-hydrolysing)